MKGSISCTFFESYSNVLNLNLGISGEKGRVREKKTRGVGQEEGARGHAGRRECGHRGQAVQGEPGEGDPGRDRGAAGAEGEHRDGPQAERAGDSPHRAAGRKCQQVRFENAFGSSARSSYILLRCNVSSLYEQNFSLQVGS